MLLWRRNQGRVEGGSPSYPLPPLHVQFLVRGEKIIRILLLPSFSFRYELIEERSAFPIHFSLQEKIDKWIGDYLAKKSPRFSLPLELSSLSSFSLSVLKEIEKVPFGQSATYREISAHIGLPKGARAVGNACHRNPFPLLIPCHRIMGVNQKITGFAFGLEMKRQMLAFESISYS